MTRKQKAPVVASTLDPAQLRSVMDFMKGVQRDNTIVANIETRRLAPYLDAMARQLKADLQKIEDANEREQLTAIANPRSMRRIFNAIAKDTRNTILSEIIVAPEDVLEDRALKRSTRQFNGKIAYNKIGFTLGFVQTFTDDEKTSVSMPVLAFNSDMMSKIEEHAPEKMLRAFQAVMTAGNHDMQHHFTNRFLNENIAQTHRIRDDDYAAFTPLSELSVKKWTSAYFSYQDGMRDTHPKSYESWLMLNHARMRKQMEDRPEGRALWKKCDIFFDELDRIGKKIAQSPQPDALKQAHDTVDYFGTVFCFAMMRYMPLDHPLFEYAIRRLEKADPQPAPINEMRKSTFEKVEKTISDAKDQLYPDSYMKDAIDNYRTKGIDLMPDQADYLALKKLHVMMIEPWVAHLLGPAPAGSVLQQAQDRVDKLSREMMTAAAVAATYSPKEGRQFYTLTDGSTIEMHRRNGKLHRLDGPALTEHFNDGIKRELWYKDGILFNKDGANTVITHANGDREEMSYKDGVLHATNGPAYVAITATNRTEKWMQDDKLHRIGAPSKISIDYPSGDCYEEWHVNGELHRIGAPAFTMVKDDGTTEEQWRKDGQLHREDGPALVIKHPDGSFTEKWYLNGVLHRKDGPACTVMSADGASEEEWHDEGKLHRDGAPAVIKHSNDGTITETWCKNGKKHRIGAPAHTITTKHGLKLTEEWYEDGLPHREDGPAIRSENSLGYYNEEWHKHGRLYRKGAPAKITKPAQGGYREEWSESLDILNHRENGPSLIEISPEKIREEKWLKGWQLDRADGPAHTRYYPDGGRDERWYKNGYHHRLDGPAVDIIKADGSTIQEWHINGRNEREDGPSHISKNADGSSSEMWRFNGRYHRTDGPAVTEIFANGICKQKWYNNGVLEKEEETTVLVKTLGQKGKSSYKHTYSAAAIVKLKNFFAMDRT